MGGHTAHHIFKKPLPHYWLSHCNVTECPYWFKLLEGRMLIRGFRGRRKCGVGMEKQGSQGNEIGQEICLGVTQWWEERVAKWGADT